MKIDIARIAHLAFYCSLLTSGACAQVPPDGQWTQLQAFYKVSGGPLTVKSESVENPAARVEKISFTGPEGDVVKGYFYRPLAEGVYPAALLLHGLGDSAKGLVDTIMAKALV